MATKSRPLDTENVEKKLRNITNTQESIQSMSLWVIFHKAHHEKIVEIWFNILQKSKVTHRLTLLYLCNDIVQTCKKKHAIVFKDAFKEVLKDAALLVREASIREKAERIFNIWRERNVYDVGFIDELTSILNNTEIRTTGNSKLLADFKPHLLVQQVLKFKQVSNNVELKRRHLVVLSLDASNLESVRLLKDRVHGKEYSQQFEDACQKLEDYVKHLSEEINDRVQLIEALEQSEIFYDAQYGEAKVVTNAYKNFGNRVNNLRRKLEEHRATLPDLTAAVYAPSPVNSPLLGDADNKTPVDMDLSDEGGQPTIQAAGDVSPKSLDSAPSPEGSPVDLNFSPNQPESSGALTEDNGDSLDAIANLLPPLAKGAQASFMRAAVPAASASPQQDPRGKRSSSAEWGMLNEGNLVQLTEESGSGTPVKDEELGRSTPVLDEVLASSAASAVAAAATPEGGSDGEAEAKPIDFLTNLITNRTNQTQPVRSGFLGSLSLLSDKLKTHFMLQPSESTVEVPDEVPVEVPAVAQDEDQDGVNDQSKDEIIVAHVDNNPDDSDLSANSWAAWKAQQAPPSPKKDAPPMPEPPQPPLYATFPMTTFPSFPPQPPPVPRPPLPPLQQAGQWSGGGARFGSFNAPTSPCDVQPPPVPPAGLRLAPPAMPQPSMPQPPMPQPPMLQLPMSQPPQQQQQEPAGMGWTADNPSQTFMPRPPIEPPATSPVTPTFGRGIAGVEEEQNEFIRKLKRKTSISAAPPMSPTSTTPQQGIIQPLTHAISTTPIPPGPMHQTAAAMNPAMHSNNTHTLSIQTHPASAPTHSGVHPESPHNASMHAVPPPMHYNTTPQSNLRTLTETSESPSPAKIMSVVQRVHGSDPGDHRRGRQDGGYRDSYNSRHRDSYGRLPPKRPAPPYNRSGYYQRY